MKEDKRRKRGEACAWCDWRAEGRNGIAVEDHVALTTNRTKQVRRARVTAQSFNIDQHAESDPCDITDQDTILERHVSDWQRYSDSPCFVCSSVTFEF